MTGCYIYQFHVLLSFLHSVHIRVDTRHYKRL